MAIAGERPKCPYCGKHIEIKSDVPFDGGIWADWKGHNKNCIHHPLNKKEMSTTSTKVVCECISKKESKNYNPEHPVHTAIELAVPYDQSSIYFQMSGGAVMTLNTVNQDAANMFVLGGKYDLVISPTAQA